MPRIVKTLDTKDPSEGDVITFDFSLSMPTGSSIVGTPAVICEVAFGTDPSPSSVLSGVPSVSGSIS